MAKNLKIDIRNDILARILHIKIKKIMHLLTIDQIFSPNKCYLHVHCGVVETGPTTRA